MGGCLLGLDSVHIEDAGIRDQLRWGLTKPFGNLPSRKNFGHVGACFANRWHAFMAGHVAFTCIVASQCQNRVVAKMIQQPFQISDTTLDVLRRIFAICHAKPCCGRRHQLHKTLRPG